ncbi:MAG: Pirin [Labilithrix sp.]|nr:Pirin [Labilithrix sp.]
MTQSTTTTSNVTNATSASVGRAITKSVRGMATSDGAGVKLTRLIGTPLLRRVDPFLMLDEFRSDEPQDYLAGFPDHPHRGFETFTYMLAGKFRHRDNKGHEGLLGAGGGQWMTAGRGIVHSEMPEQEEGLVWGFQLWINLPAAEKMTAAGYRDLQPEDIPIAELPGGATARVVAGRVANVVGPIEGKTTAPIFVEVGVPAGGEATIPVPRGHEGFVYAFEGNVRLGDIGKERVLTRGELAVLGDGEHVRLSSAGDAARALVIAGKPLNEPIAQHGPFVMNTTEQIQQAIRDFQNGEF